MPRARALRASVVGVILIAFAMLTGPPVASPIRTSSATLASSPAAQASPASQPADFNGDGFADLAVGVPYEAVGDISAAGAVNVLYGSSTGLTASGSQFWHQDSPGLNGDGAQQFDNFGWDLAAGDFNGDGYGDLAGAAPSENVGSLFDAGAVIVLYGSSTGLTADGSQFWHEDSPGVKGRAEDEDLFGYALAARDFNGDRFSDLTVGIPFEDHGSADAGAVAVLYGSTDGLSSTGSQVWHQNSPGVEGTAEGGDLFGWALAAANFGKSSHADLAVGVLFEAVGAVDEAGAVNVLYGSTAGLTASRDQLWTQASPKVEGTVEEGDRFGSALAAANFGKSSQGDLAVASAGEDVGPVSDAGAVNVIYGSSVGLTATGDQLWHQNSPGVNDKAERGDGFGAALSAANFGKSSKADLAVGACCEDVSSGDGAGAANILYGSSTGITSSGDQFWHQDSPGVEDEPEDSDAFGGSLAAANFGGSTQADLVIGVVAESVGSIFGAGAVNVLYGSGNGLSAIGSQFWHQDSPGLQGDGAEVEDTFAASLAPRR